MQRLRVPENATNEQIQVALHQLFNQGPQGKSVQSREEQGHQGRAIVKTSGPQGTENEVKSIIAATAVSKVQLDNSFRDSLHSFL